jgi:hypothetical protein
MRRSILASFLIMSLCPASIRCLVGVEKIRARAESIGTSKPQSLQKRKVEAGSTVEFNIVHIAEEVGCATATERRLL